MTSTLCVSNGIPWDKALVHAVRFSVLFHPFQLLLDLSVPQQVPEIAESKCRWWAGNAAVLPWLDRQPILTDARGALSTKARVSTLSGQWAELSPLTLGEGRAAEHEDSNSRFSGINVDCLNRSATDCITRQAGTTLALLPGQLQGQLMMRVMKMIGGGGGGGGGGDGGTVRDLPFSHHRK
ncbi:hypothetical protein TYRP_020723 [Tyrophagus putrescentiae]|nr:hypothetical protein TYRP_020723 [Tyrophagus putrescentiae]